MLSKIGISNGYAINVDTDMSRRLQNVDALERVLRVLVNGRIFLEPLVHGCKVDLHQPAQGLGMTSQSIPKSYDLVDRPVTNFEDQLAADVFAVLGVIGFAFRDLERWVLATAGLELGFGDVELGEERVLPDIVGICCVEDVVAVE